MLTAPNPPKERPVAARRANGWVAQAEEMGANAIVGMRFVTSMVLAGASELLAYGTAVIVEDER